jgi:hypothetical protein
MLAMFCGAPAGNRSALSLVLAFATCLAGCEAKPSGDFRRGAATTSQEAPKVAQADLKVPAGAVGKPADHRKIIYRAKVELAVEDFTPVQAMVAEAVKKFDGYIADSSLTGSAGSIRRGTWKIRIPAARFDEFVAAAKGFGELINASTTSEDVSEEYFDVEARIRNKTKEEERLLKLLDDRTGKLADVLEVERELSRVREETERMQGRMRVLADLTTLTTVELVVTEMRNYEPPQAADLATRVRRAFTQSVDGLREFGESLLIGAVAFAPWLPVFFLAILPILWLGRRIRRRRQERLSRHGSI